MPWLGPAQAQDKVFITEFVADNAGALLDQDGDASDWIEIYNTGPDTVDLNGWHLTDEPGNLAKWTFPATNLPPGGFLLVFASAKNRAVSGQELHANFQLDSNGEYLALVKPDGVTIAHDYAPAFPPQLKGVSLTGVDLSITTNQFISSSGAAVKWKIPHSSLDLPADWATTNFADALSDLRSYGGGFRHGRDQSLSPVSATNNVALNKATTQTSTNSTFGANLAVNGNYTDFSHTLAGVNLPATWEVDLGTNYGVERIVLWNRTSNRSRLRDITVRVLNQSGTVTNFTSTLLNPENVLGGGVLNLGPTKHPLNLTQLTGGLVFGGRVRITRTPDPDLSGSGGAGTTSEADVLALAELEVFRGCHHGYKRRSVRRPDSIGCRLFDAQCERFGIGSHSVQHSRPAGPRSIAAPDKI